MKLLTVMLFLLVANFSFASTLAIIDSGTDIQHGDLVNQIWKNTKEIPDNNRDEDKNGYQDDVYGWNFAEGNNLVIDYSYLGTLNNDIRKFFDIQAKMFLGGVTQEEIDWMKVMREDQEFIKSLQIYGNFMHGTHVAGISISQAPDANILAVKLIPTEVKLPFSLEQKTRDRKIQDKLLKGALDLLADTQVGQMKEIARFVGDHGASVANGSFGTGYMSSGAIISVAFKAVFFRDPTAEERDQYISYFLTSLSEKGKAFVSQAKDTLFVFAAGNDGTDNDKFPTFPASIQADNVITVAATIGSSSLASFSCFGQNSVHLGAPGVSINSAVPGDQYLKVSGTSQAAPYVASLAARIKDANPSLGPAQIKKILVDTVDKRSFLVAKISSEGIANSQRAIKAAQLSVNLNVNDAIATSLSEVADQGYYGARLKEHKMAKEFVLPLNSNFKL